LSLIVVWCTSNKNEIENMHILYFQITLYLYLFGSNYSLITFKILDSHYLLFVFAVF
jgi:hypothetical protein